MAEERIVQPNVRIPCSKACWNRSEELTPDLQAVMRHISREANPNEAQKCIANSFGKPKRGLRLRPMRGVRMSLSWTRKLHPDLQAIISHIFREEKPKRSSQSASPQFCETHAWTTHETHAWTTHEPKLDHL